MSGLTTCSVFISKSFLTMFFLDESLSDITFLTGKVFIHMTEKYMIMVMSNLWRYLNGIVVMMHWFIDLTVQIIISILENIFFDGGGIHNNIVYQIICSLVKIHFHKDSFYYHATSGIDFHNSLTDLLNFLTI